MDNQAELNKAMYDLARNNSMSNKVQLMFDEHMRLTADNVDFDLHVVSFEVNAELDHFKRYQLTVTLIASPKL